MFNIEKKNINYIGKFFNNIISPKIWTDLTEYYSMKNNQNLFYFLIIHAIPKLQKNTLSTVSENIDCSKSVFNNTQ